MYNRSMRILFLILIALLLLHAFSCASQKTNPKEGVVYKMDLEMENVGKESIGMMWLPRKDLYTLEFKASDKIDVLLFRTCSREFVVEDPRRILSRKKFVYNYRPNEIELAGNCPATIFAINDKGMTTGGFIDFMDEFTTLPAHNICGAITEDTIGVSVCQEKKGSFEQISFDVEVSISPDLGCEINTPLFGKVFKYEIRKGICSYQFMETVYPYRVHRLTTRGYEDIQIRKD